MVRSMRICEEGNKKIHSFCGIKNIRIVSKNITYTHTFCLFKN